MGSKSREGQLWQMFFKWDYPIDGIMTKLAVVDRQRKKKLACAGKWRSEE